MNGEITKLMNEKKKEREKKRKRKKKERKKERKEGKKKERKEGMHGWTNQRINQMNQSSFFKQSNKRCQS